MKKILDKIDEKTFFFSKNESYLCQSCPEITISGEGESMNRQTTGQMHTTAWHQWVARCSFKACLKKSKSFTTQKVTLVKQKVMAKEWKICDGQCHFQSFWNHRNEIWRPLPQQRPSFWPWRQMNRRCLHRQWCVWVRWRWGPCRRRGCTRGRCCARRPGSPGPPCCSPLCPTPTPAAAAASPRPSSTSSADSVHSQMAKKSVSVSKKIFHNQLIWSSNWISVFCTKPIHTDFGVETSWINCTQGSDSPNFRILGFQGFFWGRLKTMLTNPLF